MKKTEPIQRFEAACRALGLPVTVQRRRILETLQGRTDHPTPEQVYAMVKDTLPGVSRTTIYRVLETLVAVGVLAKVCSPGAAIRVDPETARHHHLACQHCDRLFDVEDTAVDHHVRPPDVRRQGFAIEAYSIYFTGVCAACRQAAQPSRRAVARAGDAARRPISGENTARTRPRRMGRRGR